MAKLPNDKIQPQSGYVFPDMERLSMEEKQKPEYFLQIMQAFYQEYVSNYGDIKHSGGELDTYINQLRLIAEGKQDVQQYLDFLNGSSNQTLQNLVNDLDVNIKSNAEASRKGYLTGYNKALSIIPNMVTRFKGELAKLDIDIKAHCIDVNANSEEIFRMNKEWVKQKPAFRKPINLLRSLIDLPQQNEVYADSYEAMLDIKNEGGFKERYIQAGDEIIEHTFDVSDWATYLKEENGGDLFTIGAAFNFIDFDYNECKVVCKYKDVKDCVKPFGTRKDGRDAQSIGWFDYLNLNKIREVSNQIVNAETGDVGLTADDLDSIAQTYNDYARNSKSNYLNSNRRHDKDSIDIDVCTMTMRWFDVKKKRESEYTNKGRTTIVKYKPGQEDNKAYKVTETREIVVNQCTWLLGTPYVWRYGTMPNQIYINGAPSLGFAFFATKEESYIERLVPIAHTFAIAWMNFVNLLGKAQKDFVAIDVDRLAIFSDGSKKYDADTALELLRTELVFFYKSQAGNPRGGDDFPIKFVNGISQDQLMSELNIMEQMLRLAEMVTGLSPVTLGATPSERSPVRTTLASLNSSNVALSYITGGVMEMKRQLAQQIIPYVSNLIEIDEKAYNYYSKVIGTDSVEALKANRDSVHSLGIKYWSSPTEEMMMKIDRAIEISMQAGLVELYDALRLQNKLAHGQNFMAVIHELEYRIKSQRKQQQAEKEALVREQTEGQNRIAQTQAQMKQQEMQMKTASEEQEERIRAAYQNLAVREKAEDEWTGKVIEKKLELGENPDDVMRLIEGVLQQRSNQLVNAGTA